MRMLQRGQSQHPKTPSHHMLLTCLNKRYQGPTGICPTGPAVALPGSHPPGTSRVPDTRATVVPVVRAQPLITLISRT